MTGKESLVRFANPLLKFVQFLGVLKRLSKIVTLVRFLGGVLKSEIQPERPTLSATEAKETLNEMLRKLVKQCGPQHKS